MNLSEALSFIQRVKTGQHTKPSKKTTLNALFYQYTCIDRLKPSTLKSYTEVVFYYLSDWINKPVSSTSKEMVEHRFFQIRDKGYAPKNQFKNKQGKPSYSQATKTMRVLSALMNYAKGDDII